MLKEFILAVLALSSVPAAAQQMSISVPATAKPVATTISSVVDGDTFVMGKHWSIFPYLNWSIRILGMDTPEKTVFAGAKCQHEIDLGNAATDYAKAMVKQKGVTVTLTKVNFDKYGGRFDAVVTFADGTNWGDNMVAAGYARPYFGVGPKPDWCAGYPLFSAQFIKEHSQQR